MARTEPIRLDALAQLGLFVASFVLLAWVGVREEFNGLLSDSYVYLAAAAALGEDAALLWHIVAAYPFPPLFPLVLAAVGGGSAAPAPSYLLGAGLLAVVAVQLVRWLRGSGVPFAAALLAGAAFAVLPLTLQSAMGVLSEPLYMVCIFASILALPTRATPPRRLARAWCIAALWVALASLTRSVGVAAVAAFGVHWVISRGWRASRLAPFIAVLPFTAWTLARKFAAWNDYAVSTLTARDPWRLLDANVTAWREFAVKGVDVLMREHTATALAVLGALIGCVWVYRLSRGRYDACYVAAYLAIMAVWPYPHHAARFLFVLVPLAIGYAVWGLAALFGRLHVPASAQRVLPALVPLVLLLLAAPSVLSMLTQLWRNRAAPIAVAMRAPSWYLSAPSVSLSGARFSERIVEFQRAELPQVPAGACVASVIPQQVLVYGRRRGIDLTQVSARGQTLEDVFADCPYVLMIAARPYPPVAGVGSLYPLDDIRDRMDVIALERDRPGDPDSALLAMLAKVR